MARKSRKHLPLHEDAVIEPQAVIYNAGAYVRLSSDDKKKRGDSLETQRNIIENFVAVSTDIRIVEVYSDNNATGTNFDRPGFQRMLADAESGRINCIIVKDLSRFGRNAIDSGYYIEKYLPLLGVRFIAITDQCDSNDGDAGIILPLKNLISESYALDISRKCKAVQRQNIRDGRFVGRMAPYGFDKNPEDCRHLVVDPEAAAVVRRIFDWAEQGLSGGEILRTLNDEGVPPPSHYKKAKGLIANKKLVGKPYWQKRTVAGILADRVYVGDMVQGKTRTINHKEVAVDPGEWVCVENTHEPIISREQFDAVQEMIRQASERDKAVRRDAIPYSAHVFKGKIFCAHCGHPMHRHRQNKDGVYWFRCESQWKYKEAACVQVSVKEAEVKTELLAMLHKQAEVVLGRCIRLEREDDSGGEARLREISRQLHDKGRYRKSLYESLVSSLITEDEFLSMKSRYNAEIEALSNEADEIRRQMRDRHSAVLEARDVAAALSGALTEKDLTAEIVDKLIERIVVSRDKSFDVRFRFHDEFEEVLCVG